MERVPLLCRKLHNVVDFSGLQRRFLLRERALAMPLGFFYRFKNLLKINFVDVRSVIKQAHNKRHNVIYINESYTLNNSNYACSSL